MYFKAGNEWFLNISWGEKQEYESCLSSLIAFSSWHSWLSSNVVNTCKTFITVWHSVNDTELWPKVCLERRCELASLDVYRWWCSVLTTVRERREQNIHINNCIYLLFCVVSSAVSIYQHYYKYTLWLKLVAVCTKQLVEYVNTWRVQKLYTIKLPLMLLLLFILTV